MSDYLCSICLVREATCYGSYEGMPPNFACDDCCGHGCEDGSCELFKDHDGDPVAAAEAWREGTWLESEGEAWPA